HCFTTTHTSKASLPEVFANIRKTGVEQSMLSSDLGQTINPAVAEGLAMYAQHFLDAGFSVEEIHEMAATTPGRLLGDSAHPAQRPPSTPTRSCKAPPACPTLVPHPACCR